MRGLIYALFSRHSAQFNSEFIVLVIAQRFPCHCLALKIEFIANLTQQIQFEIAQRSLQRIP